MVRFAVAAVHVEPLEIYFRHLKALEAGRREVRGRVLLLSGED